MKMLTRAAADADAGRKVKYFVRGNMGVSYHQFASLKVRGGLTVNGVSQGGEITFPTYPRDNAEYTAVIPEGTLFVLGDHRTDTQDSRDYGPIPLDSVEGKVISILRRRGL